jgi:hypothetical protein
MMLSVGGKWFLGEMVPGGKWFLEPFPCAWSFYISDQDSPFRTFRDDNLNHTAGMGVLRPSESFPALCLYSLTHGANFSIEPESLC